MKDSILDTIGSPLVSVRAPEGATVAAKIESFNPGGSAKDRPAKYMIDDAERRGSLGAEFACRADDWEHRHGMARSRNDEVDVVLVMPASMSPERRDNQGVRRGDRTGRRRHLRRERPR